MQKVVHAMEQLANAPIYIDDTPGISLSEMRAKARRLQQSVGSLDLIIVDYLQLMQATIGGRRNENRVMEISEISRSLKALARELNLPVLALAQLSRAVENRQSKVPQLSDLREKSVDPMALKAGMPPRTLQEFLGCMMKRAGKLIDAYAVSCALRTRP